MTWFLVAVVIVVFILLLMWRDDHGGPSDPWRYAR